MKLTKFLSTFMLGLFMLTVFTGFYAMADDSVVSPVDFLDQVVQAAKVFGGLPEVLKIASIVTILIASMKVSFLNDLVWSKLGAAKSWVAPLLGLVAGLLGLGAGGQPITLASAFAYMAAGAGAVILHELLDSIKAIPGLGPQYVAFIELVEKVLGGPASKPPALVVAVAPPEEKVQ